MTIVYRWKLLLLGSQPPWFTPRNMPEQVRRVDAAAPGHAVLAVGREDVVVVAQRPAGADLGGLLAQQRGPQAQLALALQRGRLGVEAAGQHHVAVQPAQLVGGQVDRRSRGCSTRSPSGVSSCTSSGLGHRAAVGASCRGACSRCALAASRACARQCSPRSRAAPPSVRPPGSAGWPVRLTRFRYGARGGCGAAGPGVTGAPASGLQQARYPVSTYLRNAADLRFCLDFQVNRIRLGTSRWSQPLQAAGTTARYPADLEHGKRLSV